MSICSTNKPVSDTGVGGGLRGWVGVFSLLNNQVRLKLELSMSFCSKNLPLLISNLFTKQTCIFAHNFEKYIISKVSLGQTVSGENSRRLEWKFHDFEGETYRWHQDGESNILISMMSDVVISMVSYRDEEIICFWLFWIFFFFFFFFKWKFDSNGEM